MLLLYHTFFLATHNPGNASSRIFVVSAAINYFTLLLLNTISGNVVFCWQPLDN